MSAGEELNGWSSLTRKVVIGGVAAAVAGAVSLTGAPAQAQQVSAYSFTGMGDWNGDGHADIVVGTPDGDWLLYPGSGMPGPSGREPVVIASGQYGTTFAGMGDWDGDHKDDIVFRDSDGDLKTLPGGGSEVVTIGYSWRGVTFAGVGDWDGDGHDDVIFRRDAAYGATSGQLRVYTGRGKPGPNLQNDTQLIGYGFGSITFVGVGDWDGDHHDDIAYRRDAAYGETSGNVLLYQGRGAPGPNWASQGPVIGFEWGSFTSVGMGDWNGDRHDDIAYRENNGDVRLYAGDGTPHGNNQERVLIAQGW